MTLYNLPKLMPGRPLNLVGRKHAALRTKGEIVRTVDQPLIELAGRMYATCLARSALALTACQVGTPIALVVTNQGVGYINPQVRVLGVLDNDDEAETGLEGCMTMPGRWYAARRGLTVDVVVTTLDEQTHRETVYGLVARMWQHEADHLAGRLLFDDWPESNQGACPLPTGGRERLAQLVAEQGLAVDPSKPAR